MTEAKLDGCRFCLGAKGGTPGNENLIAGVVVCDYCSSLLMDMDKTSQHCPVHYGAIHGGEAEELRAGIETLIEIGGATVRDLQSLVDRVDARDSLAHIESRDGEPLRDAVRRLHKSSERAPDVRAVPMRLVRQDVFDEMMKLVGGGE